MSAASEALRRRKRKNRNDILLDITDVYLFPHSSFSDCCMQFSHEKRLKQIEKNVLTYLFECFRYIVAKTMQTTANKIAAVRTNAASTGETGTFMTFDTPETRNGKRKNVKLATQTSGELFFHRHSEERENKLFQIDFAESFSTPET